MSKSTILIVVLVALLVLLPERNAPPAAPSYNLNPLGGQRLTLGGFGQWRPM